MRKFIMVKKVKFLKKQEYFRNIYSNTVNINGFLKVGEKLNVNYRTN